MTPAQHNANEPSAWLHRLTVVLACATFPLIFVGGTVTTYQAGMAVYDYPTTFGYNLFLYPISTWLAGPWNVFVEHGHRLFAALVGLLSIGVAAVAARRESRSWVRRLCYFALFLVCFQGALGGARVLLNEVAVARIHGCVAPIFFALATVLALATSRRWRDSTNVNVAASSVGSLQRLSAVTVGMIYLQIVAGSYVRHISPLATIDGFRIPIFFHLLLAAGILIHVLWLAFRVFRHHRGEGRLTWNAGFLALLLLAQIALGGATYVLKYNWPGFLSHYDFAAGLVLERGAFVTSMVTTGHVAVGALSLVTAVSIAVWSFRLHRPAVLPGPGFDLLAARGWKGATA